MPLTNAAERLAAARLTEARMPLTADVILRNDVHRLEFIKGELATHKRKWEAGSFPDLFKAFLLCTANGHPVDEWIADVFLKEMTDAFNRGRTASGKRGKASPKAKYKNNRIAQMRWGCAQHWLANLDELPRHGHLATRDGAFAYTSECLRGTIAQASPETIEDTYDEVKKGKKRGTFVAF